MCKCMYRVRYVNVIEMYPKGMIHSCLSPSPHHTWQSDAPSAQGDRSLWWVTALLSHVDNS